MTTMSDKMRKAFEAFCAQECSPCADRAAWYWHIWRRAWQAALSTLPAPAPAAQGANPWREAIDEALIVSCLDPVRDDETAEQALARLVAWEVNVALDPAVSSEAAALVERGKVEAQGAAQQAPAVPQWQPIETAPKDGTAVLVMRDIWPGTVSGRAEECNGHNTYVAQWWSHEGSAGAGRWVCYMDWIADPKCPVDPTHWMPLPDVPAAPQAPAAPSEQSEGYKPLRRGWKIGGTAALPLDEWSEEDGAVLWWRFPIEEPPYVGNPLCDDWPDYHTHWTPLDLPAAPSEGEA